jgi:hypothetical protein
MLGFATVGLFLFYVAFRYNILFVSRSQVDTQGLIYPRALQQLMVGVYLGEVCMIGLFATALAWGPLVLTIIFLIFTILFHMSLNKALGPLLYTLPKTLEAEEESYRGLDIEANGTSPSITNEKQSNSVDKTAPAISSAPHAKPSILAKFLKPHIYTDYATLRRLVPEGAVDYHNYYSETVERDAYYPPSVKAETPIIWIPRDIAGVSKQEVAHTQKVIAITDEGAELDEKNKLVWDHEGARPPVWEEKIYY